MQASIDFYDNVSHDCIRFFEGTSLFETALRAPLQSIFFGKPEDGILVVKNLLTENGLRLIDPESIADDIVPSANLHVKFVVDITPLMQKICLSKQGEDSYQQKTAIFYLTELALRDELRVQIICDTTNIRLNEIPTEISSRLLSLNNIALKIPSVAEVQIVLKNISLYKTSAHQIKPEDCKRSYDYLWNLAKSI